jgi:hypothetical protein
MEPFQKILRKNPLAIPIDVFSGDGRKLVSRIRNVLANDERVNGVSERGGFTVVRKKTQWRHAHFGYAERLLQGLNDIDWSRKY